MQVQRTEKENPLPKYGFVNVKVAGSRENDKRHADIGRGDLDQLEAEVSGPMMGSGSLVDFVDPMLICDVEAGDRELGLT